MSTIQLTSYTFILLSSVAQTKTELSPVTHDVLMQCTVTVCIRPVVPGGETLS